MITSHQNIVYFFILKWHLTSKTSLLMASYSQGWLEVHQYSSYHLYYLLVQYGVVNQLCSFLQFWTFYYMWVTWQTCCSTTTKKWDSIGISLFSYSITTCLSIYLHIVKCPKLTKTVKLIYNPILYQQLLLVITRIMVDLHY